MKKNMGTVDKILRILTAIVFVVLYLTHTIDGVLGIILIIIAFIFLITSLIGNCPLYIPFGISTIKKEKSS